MNTRTNLKEAPAENQPRKASPAPAANKAPDGNDSLADSPVRELGMWLCALDSFFNTRNHPLTEMERAGILTRDFTNETRIAQGSLLRCLQLIAGLSRGETRTFDVGMKGEERVDAALLLEEERGISVGTDEVFDELAEIISDASALSNALLVSRMVSFHAWGSLGKVLKRELEQSGVAKNLMRRGARDYAPGLPPALLDVVERIQPESLASDMLHIFSNLVSLLEVLRFIETSLRRDQPLKQMLPIFTFIREETRSLLDLIDTRALRIEGLDGNIFDALDGTAYAIGMELRKTFEHELVGLSALRQAPHLYAKVENAHGLLRDSFQQSIVALSQIFEPTLDGAILFYAFQTKLDQSIALRSGIWTLLQHVRHAEREREQRSFTPLVERLLAFREESLRFLMYKDWESYERFVEEIGAARGAAELAPVLHRFGAYLETLFSQINMRAVLADYPFVYPMVEE